MPVPGRVLAYLVVVQAGLVLGGLEAFFDRPAGPGRADDLGRRRVRGRVHQVVGAFAVGEAAADQQGVVEAVVTLTGQRDQGPGVLAQAVGGGADLPGVLRQDRRADRSPSSDSHDHETDVTRLRQRPAMTPRNTADQSSHSSIPAD